MRATILDLRYRTKDVLKAVERGETGNGSLSRKAQGPYLAVIAKERRARFGKSFWDVEEPQGYA